MAKMIDPELQHLAVPTDQLHLWPGNPRQGDVGALSESLKRFGQVRPILVQKSTMRIVAGNHLFRAAVALGWTEVACVVSDISDKQAKAYVAADNRMSELGGFDEESLAILLADINRNDSLSGTGYDLEDLEALLAKVGKTNKVGRGDPDATKDPPEEPWVRPGMVFRLGEHRLACGDGSDWNLLDRLLDGQQPGVLIVQPPTKGQDPKDLFDHFASVPEQFWFEPHRYDLWQVGPDLGERGSGSFLIWDKQVENTHRDFAESFELIYSKASHPQSILRHTFVGAQDGEAYGGPDFNERPTALFTDLLDRWSGFEAVVLDPFSLGGTVLMACERGSKRYHGVKRDPGLCQALLEKWKEYSGLDYELVE